MSKDRLEVNDIWESMLYECVIDKVWGGEENNPFCCHMICHNKRNGEFSEETTNFRDLNTYYNYKGKAKNVPSTWYEVIE
jgi:hypothetical protein